MGRHSTGHIRGFPPGPYISRRWSCGRTRSRTEDIQILGLAAHYDFVPVAVETMGSWSDNAILFIKSLGKRLTEATGDRQETFYLLQRISVAIQRCNAICFDGCFKPVDALL